MTRKFLSLLVLALFTLNSCSTDDTADITINIGDNSGCTMVENATPLSGVYTEDLELDSSITYMLNGELIMTAGTTLRIPAGTTIYTLAGGADIYIAISQGAQIIANGTQSNPIVFTSNSCTPQAGDWGGLILLGNAPINSVSGSATSTSEIGQLSYGGTQIDDNSGSLRYVRVEYSGGSADGQTENNGISFYGVGNGTTVEYIEAFEGKDDGIEFFGGTVNASNVIVVNAQDDSVDWTEGYNGTLTNLYIKQGNNHDKGIEADGYNTDIGNNSDPVFFSKPTVNNLTIMGMGSGNGNEAVRLRAGTQGLFNNVYLNGFDEGFELVGDNANNPTGAGVISDDLQVTDVTFSDITLKMKNETGETFSESDFISGDGNGTATDVATWGANWSVGIE